MEVSIYICNNGRKHNLVKRSKQDGRDEYWGLPSLIPWLGKHKGVL